MKKLLAFILAATVVLSMTACTAKDTAMEEPATTAQVTSISKTTSVSKETISVSSVETTTEEPEEEPIQEGLVMEAPENYEYSVVITINPQITLYATYNDNNEAIVDSFKFDNDDAKDAYSDLALAKLKVDDAVKLIIKTAAAKEYLKADGNVTIDVQPTGENLPIDVIESYKEVAETTVKELDGHTGEVVLHNYDISGNEVVAEDTTAKEKEDVVKADDKKDTSKDTKKEDTKKDTKTESKKEVAKADTNTKVDANTKADTKTKTETKTETPASTPAATTEPEPAPAPTPAPATQKCDMNHNKCSNTSPAWGQEHYEDVPYEYRVDHTDTWYSIVHAVHRINGWIPCTNCGGQIPLLSYDQDVSEDDWRYEMDTNAYNAAYGAAWDEYVNSLPEDATDEQRHSSSAAAYADAHVNRDSYYRWVQY